MSLVEDPQPEEQTPEEQTPEEQKPEEQKPEEQKPEEQKPEEQKPEEQKPEEQKPVEYTDFTMPDGVEADEQFLGAFKDVAKGLELPQEQAQKLVDFYAGEVQRQAQAVEAQVKAWEAEVKADPQHEEALALAKKALSKFATPEMSEITANPLFGSNPAVVKFLSSIGRAIKEDSFLESGAGGANTKSHAERIYGSSI